MNANACVIHQQARSGAAIKGSAARPKSTKSSHLLLHLAVEDDERLHGVLHGPLRQQGAHLLSVKRQAGAIRVLPLCTLLRGCFQEQIGGEHGDVLLEIDVRAVGSRFDKVRARGLEEFLNLRAVGLYVGGLRDGNGLVVRDLQLLAQDGQPGLEDDAALLARPLFMGKSCTSSGALEAVLTFLVVAKHKTPNNHKEVVPLNFHLTISTKSSNKSAHASTVQLFSRTR
jgi:hypothetical protein